MRLTSFPNFWLLFALITLIAIYPVVNQYAGGRAFLALYDGVILLLAGCAADEPAAERYRGDALQAAYEIGQVQMSCPDATPMITSISAARPP